MKLTLKLLKGDMFQVDVEPTDAMGAVKEKIQAAKAELPAERQKLIHAGKVLKDTQTIAEVGVKESDFIVCMVTKETAKPKAAAPAPAPAPTPAPAPAVAAPAPAPAPVAAAPAPAPAAAAPAPAPTQDFVTADALAALTGMGFPEAQARAALQAAMGNPDLAYEFMLTGIPEQIQHIPAASAPAAAAAAATAAAAAAGPAAAAAAAAAVAAPTADGVPSIESLRSHPQFNMLKQLIQSNPQSLPQVLNLIGQQSPQLLQAIHANEAAFLAMMNEPITNAPAPAPAAATPAAAAPVGGMPGMPGMPAGLPGLGPPGQLNPAQMVQMLAAMPPQERAALSAQLGISPEQLNMFMQMVSTMPPEQLQEMLAGAGAGAGARGPPPGTIALTQEEMDSVNRLMALGFSQAQAAQAFIACDRNETLAANFLFESGFDDEMEDAGAFQDGGDDGGDDDNMYS